MKLFDKYSNFLVNSQKMANKPNNDILKNPMFEDLLILEEKYVEDHVKERYCM